MRKKPLIVFLKNSNEPMSISELSRKSGLPAELLRGRNLVILRSSQTVMYKGERRAVFTKDDLRPAGEPRKTPIQSDKPASKDLNAILNRGFGPR